MIAVTKLNQEELVINARQIESVEACPDTRITLINGKQLYVRESPDEIVTRVWAWLRSIATTLPGDEED